jgi:hypothetical protein
MVPAMDVSETDFQGFFALQESNFINRRANIRARFQENRRLRQDDDCEDDLEEEANEDQEVPFQEFPEVA